MKYTIEDLSKGKCAVQNDGTLGELKGILSAAFPKDECTMEGGGISYSACTSLDGNWAPNITTDLPIQSVKDFLTEETTSKPLDVSELVKGEIYYLEENTFKCIFIYIKYTQDKVCIGHSGCYIYSSSRYSNSGNLAINSDVELRLATPNEKVVFIEKSRENNNPIKLNSEDDSNIPLDTVHKQRAGRVDLEAVKGEGILSQMSDNVEPFSWIKEGTTRLYSIDTNGIDPPFESKSKSKLIKTSKIKTFNR